MLDVFFFLMAVAGSVGNGDGAPMAQSSGSATVPAVAREAEDQTPSGKFLRASEIKMILTATKPNWVAVREFNGQDLVYFTHLLSWRCGLYEINFSINGGPMQAWPMPPCHEDGPSPNALTPEDGLPYMGYELGSVQQVEVEILYDDLTTDSASFDRTSVLMP